MSTISIPLTQGKTALIDAEDLPRVSAYRWYAVHKGRLWYAVAKSGRQVGGRTAKDNRLLVMMHRLILDAPRGVAIDHIDLNGMNNTRANLRLATGTQNKANSARYRTNTSGYKGVSWHKRQQAWSCYVTAGQKRVHLGYFSTAEEAAHTYDAKARELFGPFARCNFSAEHR